MADSYTKEELEGMKRAELRQIAAGLGMGHREASQSKSADLVEFIMKKQGGAKKAAPAAKGRAGKGKVEEPEDAEDAEEAVEDKEDAEDAEDEEKKPAKGGGLSKRVDAIGKELDEMSGKLERANYILIGLVKELLSSDWEPEDVDKRIEELNKEFDSGN